MDTDQLKPLPHKIKTLDEVIKEHLLYVLKSSPTTTKAAENLGIGRSTLYRWLGGYGIYRVNGVLKSIDDPV